MDNSSTETAEYHAGYNSYGSIFFKSNPHQDGTIEAKDWDRGLQDAFNDMAW